MVETNREELKRIFKNLVRKVKYYKSIDQEKDYSNAEVATDMGLDHIYFNSLVSKAGIVNQDHINTIILVYPDLLKREDLINNKIENKTPDSKEPGELLTQILDYEKSQSDKLNAIEANLNRLLSTPAVQQGLHQAKIRALVDSRGKSNTTPSEEKGHKKPKGSFQKKDKKNI